jgi:hypothetical protein
MSECTRVPLKCTTVISRHLLETTPLFPYK